MTAVSGEGGRESKEHMIKGGKKKKKGKRKEMRIEFEHIV